MKIKLMVLCALVILSLPAISKEGRTIDGRYNTQCYVPPGRQDALCVVSFYRLISRPEFYNGKRIELTGFIIKTLGSYVIFPSEASFYASQDIEGVELQGNISIDDGFSGDLDGGSFPVKVSGIFDAHYEGAGVERLGALKDVRIYNYHFVHRP